MLWQFFKTNIKSIYMKLNILKQNFHCFDQNILKNIGYIQRHIGLNVLHIGTVTVMYVAPST